MVSDGKKLAQKVIEKLKEDAARKSLFGKKIGVVVVEPTEEVMHFVRKKQAVAEELGLVFRLFEYPKNISRGEFIVKVDEIGRETDVVGMIIQLPLPPHLDSQKVFNAIPALKDIDLLSEESFHSFFLNRDQEEILPPVVGAIDYLIKSAGIDLKGKSAVVFGAGKLIGIPSLAWLAKKNVSVLSFAVWSESAAPYLRNADIVIVGLGNPGVLKGECLKNGVCVFDVGYSMVDGKPKGDVDFDSVKDKAQFITPVPGGIGPLTVAVLFENLFKFYRLQSK